MAIPGEGNCNPLQDSHLEKSTDTGAWWAVSRGYTPEHAYMRVEGGGLVAINW